MTDFLNAPTMADCVARIEAAVEPFLHLPPQEARRRIRHAFDTPGARCYAQRVYRQRSQRQVA